MTDQPPVDHRDPEQQSSIKSTTNVSGGVDLDAQRDVNIGGDVVGRDKITEIVEGDKVAGDQQVIEVEPGGVVVAKGGRLTNVHLPRGVQIAIGIAVVAIVVFVIKALTPASAKVNTEFIFDASDAMAQSERWSIAQTVFGDQATYATRREQLALRTVGGGCTVPADPAVPLGADQADRLVSAVRALKPQGDAALVDSIKAAADDLPADADAQNTIILVSAGEDTCLIKTQKDPCVAMSAVADSLKRAGIKFTLHIVALRAGDKARQQLVCLAQASANGYVYQANSVEDLQAVLKQVERGEIPAQIPENWPISHTLEVPYQVYDLGWSADGKQIVASTDLGMLSWDLESNRTITTASGGGVTGVWSPDGKRLAYSGTRGNIVIWDGASEIVLESDASGYGGAYDFAWSPDGKKIASGTLGGYPFPIWDIASKTALRVPGDYGTVFKVAWSPDGKYVASGGDTVRIWNADNGQPVQTLKVYANSGLTWSPDSRQLAVKASGIQLSIWDVPTGKLVTTMDTFGGDMRWSPDGAYLITSNYDVIDAKRQELVGALADTQKQRVSHSSLAWSPDGARVAIGSILRESGKDRYLVQVWNVPQASH
jgi:WD40 repeat protein